jgi:hypothetical protein
LKHLEKNSTKHQVDELINMLVPIMESNNNILREVSNSIKSLSIEETMQLYNHLLPVIKEWEALKSHLEGNGYTNHIKANLALNDFIMILDKTFLQLEGKASSINLYSASMNSFSKDWLSEEDSIGDSI